MAAGATQRGQFEQAAQHWQTASAAYAQAGDPRTAEIRLAEAARQGQTPPDSHDKAFDLLAIGHCVAPCRALESLSAARLLRI
jgi:TPR repeat protein